ncbi:very short patch repair endonuclease [Streptomyces sp. NPDC005827]|uniref:very short patch repair endonuclease n=1 Tax=Streptomyces sp. NPDC005827 TaxID=3157070 RepID=UPI0033D1DB2E
MSRQSSCDTAPEVAVRRLLHAAGLRYRVNVPVPGMPRRTIDIVFTKVQIAIFLDGCFWHGCPEHATQPKEDSEWWRAKLDKNMARDVETTDHLVAEGWTVLRFWEHESPEHVADRVTACVKSARDEAQLRGPRSMPTIADSSPSPGSRLRQPRYS